MLKSKRLNFRRRYKANHNNPSNRINRICPDVEGA
jgi:hypothetical protein